MDTTRFQNSPSGRVLQVGQGDVAYSAFVPNPLPPDLAPDWTLTRALSRADRALSELAGLGRTLPNPVLFVTPFIRREAVRSSRIEGTQSDIADLYFYEAGQMPLPGIGHPPEADVREVLNYVRALEYGLERINDLPLSLRLIREMHAHLVQGVRGNYATPGEFRSRQNWIGGNSPSDAMFVPPPVPEMMQALDVFEKYLYADDVYPPLIRMAFIHYQFETIHPFVDGNGRIGRLLLSLLTVHWGLLPLPLLYLSAYFEQHRQQYYNLLLAVSERGAWQEWVNFFLRGVESQAKDAVWRIKKLQDLQQQWHDRLRKERAAGTAMHLLDHLFANPLLTIPQASQFLGMTYRATKRHVEKLVELGILRQVGESTYDRQFAAYEILDTIIQDEQT